MIRRDAPLAVAVTDDTLTISIGIDTLAFAGNGFFQAEAFAAFGREEPATKIIDNAVWAKEVAAILEKEEEDGTTPLHMLFDAAFESAANAGSEAVEYAEENHSQGDKER